LSETPAKTAVSPNGQGGNFSFAPEIYKIFDVFNIRPIGDFVNIFPTIVGSIQVSRL
jgi:hypothetical protein